MRLGVVPYAVRAMVADSAGKVDGRNIGDNSIDSTKIANNAITTNKILNNTIKTEDLSSDLIAPMADSAKWIRPTAITNGMIGTNQISKIDGSKINPDFADQEIKTISSITARNFITKYQNGSITSGIIDTLKIEDLDEGSCYLANFYMHGDQIGISKSAIIQTLDPGLVSQVNPIGNTDYNLGTVTFTTFENRAPGSYAGDPWGRGKCSFWIVIDATDFEGRTASWQLTLTKIGGI